jgi:hypothetical protein
MVNTDAPLNGFEERLLAALRDEVAGRSAGSGLDTPRGGRTAFVLTGAAVAVGATAAVAAPILIGQHGATKAFAVSTASDGTVTASVYQFQDAAGLEENLHDVGISAVVQYAPPGKVCERPSYTHIEDTLPQPALSIGMAADDNRDGISITADRSALQGHTLVLTLVERNFGVSSGMKAYTQRHSRGLTGELRAGVARSLDVGVTDDPVGPCTLTDG